MNHQRWLWIPIGLVTLSVVTILAVAISTSGLPVPARIALGAAAIVGGSTIFWLRRNPSSEAVALETERGALQAQTDALDEQRAEFEAHCSTIQAAMEDQAARIDQRQQELADRLITFHEWMEFPKPIQFDNATARDDVRLAEKDREVLKLLTDEAQLVYERILANEYSTDNRIDPLKIRNDVFDLIQRVARIYSPTSDNPLLETSIEQLARSAGRVCLHLLIILEQLPVDVKQYNLNKTYGYIRKGVVGYGHWKAAEPYLAYLSRSLYVGRFVSGANPLTLGAWWVATELGRRGAKKVTAEFVNRQAVAMLHDIIRVIAFEVASIYGGNFRYRDPNWIYAAELTAVTSRFPMSRDSLNAALREFSTLQLRNEYDRVYLYRCLADRRVAEHRLNDHAVLQSHDREQIVSRLEKFFHSHIHGATPDRVTEWQADVEQRFDVKLQLQGRSATETDNAIQVCADSLAGFLHSILRMSPETTVAMLTDSRTLRVVDPQRRQEIVRIALEQPSSTYIPPDIDPSLAVIDDVIEDLADWTVRYAADDEQVEQLLITTSSYFRRDESAIRTQLDDHYIRSIKRTSGSEAPAATISGSMARILHRVLNDGETVSILYAGVSVDPPATIARAESGSHEMLLIGTSNTAGVAGRLLLISSASTGEALWSGCESIRARRRKGILIDDCVLSGGTWHDASAVAVSARSIVINGSIRAGGFSRYFKHLLDRCVFETTDA